MHIHLQRHAGALRLFVLVVHFLFAGFAAGAEPPSAKEALTLSVTPNGLVERHAASRRHNASVAAGPDPGKLMRHEQMPSNEERRHVAAASALEQGVSAKGAGIVDSMDAERAWDVAHVLWLVFSSFAFFLPGAYALWERWYWPAVLFILQTVVCAAYHYCDDAGPQLLLNAAVGCSDRMRHGLVHADHGFAYFIFMQMALAFIGPEDPVLQHVEENAEAHLHDASERQAQRLAGNVASDRFGAGFGVPMDVLLLNRVGAPLAMLVFLNTYSSWAAFHWECGIFCTTVVLVNFCSFWLLRHSCAVGILLRLGFWRRASQWFLGPLLSSGLLFVFMERSGNVAWLHGTWHIVLSVLAVSAMWRVTLGDSVSFGYDDLQRNPVIAHHILWVAPMLCSAAVLANIVAHPPHAGPLSWLHKPMQAFMPESTYLSTIITLLSAVVVAVAWRVVDLVSAFYDEEQQKRKKRNTVGGASAMMKWVTGSASEDGRVRTFTLAPTKNRMRLLGQISRLSLRKPAVVMGYCAICGGFLSALHHQALLSTAFILQCVAVVLATISVYGYEARSTMATRLRVYLAGSLVAARLGMTILMIQMLRQPDKNQGHTSFRHLEIMDTSLTVASSIILLLWPLTWLGEAQEALNFWVHWYRVQAITFRPEGTLISKS